MNSKQPFKNGINHIVIAWLCNAILLVVMASIGYVMNGIANDMEAIQLDIKQLAKLETRIAVNEILIARYHELKTLAPKKESVRNYERKLK